VAALVALGLYIVMREFNLYMQISVGLVVLGLAFFVILDPNRVRSALTGRQARYGSNALVLTLAFVGILVAVNYFVYENSQNWDITEDKTNTLAEETLETIAKLPEPVMARAFYSPQVSAVRAEELLKNYKVNADGKFDYEFIDPLTNPAATQAANVIRDGTVVFQLGDRQEHVTSVTEREFTGALVRLMNAEDQAIYFLTGHGEISPDDTSENSFGMVRTSLESKNYIVQTLNLLSSNQIPEDAKAVIIAGAMHPLTEEEVGMLADYLDQGGALIVMAEPVLLTEFGDSEDFLASYLAENWGITLGLDIVIDQTSTQPFVAVADQYSDHVVTEKMQRVMTAFPTARSLVLDKEITSAYPVELILSASQSWAETDFDAVASGGEVSADENDQVGPLVLAAVAESASGDGRVVVFGDSEFAADANFAFMGNGDLFINVVDWSVGQEELINLTPRSATQRFMLPPQPYILGLIQLGVIFVLPGAVLISGIIVWVQRRRRG
jgi:ABC-type uncharacterized transport system involved in gliding motility auxiliary subunit